MTYTFKKDSNKELDFPEGLVKFTNYAEMEYKFEKEYLILETKDYAFTVETLKELREFIDAAIKELSK